MLIVAIATRRAETTFATKRNKFKITAARTAIHGTTISGVTTVNHFIYVFNHGRTRMECINHFFVIVGKDIL